MEDLRAFFEKLGEYYNSPHKQNEKNITDSEAEYLLSVLN